MIRINYVTSNEFKREEIEVLKEFGVLNDGVPIKDIFEFHFYSNTMHERLEVDIEKMVFHEVKEAYSEIRIPCIVEHAGLIFNKYMDVGFPGGLTKPMWNTFKDDFLIETNSIDQKTIAKAVIAYCNGKEIKTFAGETNGVLSESPRGNRKFYWDTIFIPEPGEGLTYAEIVDKYGLKHKILKYSQSAKALMAFLEYMRANGNGELWN